MKIWKNTETLDGFIDGLVFTDKKEEADIALIGSKKIELAEFKNLKGIFRAGVGRDNVPVCEAEERGIVVRFPSRETIEAIYDETADFTCYLIFRMLYAEVGSLSPWMKYNRPAFCDRKLLVVGMGNIGRRVHSRMKTFMEVYSFDAKDDPIEKLYHFLKIVDCVTIHIPKTSENIAFFDHHKLGLMKDGAYLINTSRGEVVDEEALLEALRSGKLGGVALDVYSTEPPKRLELIKQPNVICTPHIGAQTVEAQKETSIAIAEKIIQFFNNHKARS